MSCLRTEGDPTGVRCPRCTGEIIYNGNYFCEHWAWPTPLREGQCDWALTHDDETGDPITDEDKRVWTKLRRRYQPLIDYERKVHNE